jgi:outer membrane protein TolC
MLWDSLGNPLNVDSKWIPVLEQQTQQVISENLQALADDARLNHPELKSIRIKIKQMEADKRLAAEYLKPRLDLNYYLLNQPIDPDGGFAFTGGDNYKLGLDFSFPLFLRKERSKLALTKLKLSNATLEQDVTERQIINNITSTFNQLTNLQFIISSQYQMVLNYERLLQAEMINLEQGESDLFKINVQLEKLIQAQTKWIKLRSENEKQKAYLYWAAGKYRVN